MWSRMMTTVLAETGKEKQPKPVDLAPLRAFMLRLYDGRLPTGVVDDFIRERRREAYAIRSGHEHGPA
jgi:hypothetical protein